MSEKKQKKRASFTVGEVTVHAKYVFSDDEKQRIAQELVEEMEEKENIEKSFAAIKAEFKAKIETATSNAAMLSTQYRNGFEYRSQKAQLILNFQTKEREYWDAERGIIKREPLHESDYQKELFPADENKKNG